MTLHEAMDKAINSSSKEYVSITIRYESFRNNKTFAYIVYNGEKNFESHDLELAIKACITYNEMKNEVYKLPEDKALENAENLIKGI